MLHSFIITRIVRAVVSITTPLATRAATLAVIVAALGYFVDIYDLILFGMVRTTEPRATSGVPEAARSSPTTGIYLLNMQMGGMLVGGILWGVLGDKRGRLSRAVRLDHAVLDREHRERHGPHRRQLRGLAARSPASASPASSAPASRWSAS